MVLYIKERKIFHNPPSSGGWKKNRAGPIRDATLVSPGRPIRSCTGFFPYGRERERAERESLFFFEEGTV
jgi:hypothetical protein